jgi:hypothetical protein
MKAVLLYIGLGILLIYIWLLSQKISINEMYFSDQFLKRVDHPNDERLIINPKVFNKEMVKLGGDIALKSHLLVVSLVRNCESSIPWMRCKVKVLKRVFGEVTCVFFENNSKDYTRQNLLAQVKNEFGEGVHVKVVDPFTLEENQERCISKDVKFLNNDKTGLKGAGGARIERMTYLRNRSLKWIYENQEKYTHLLLTDMDIIGRFFETGIKETVGYLASVPNVGCIGFRGFFRTGGFFDPFSYKAADSDDQHPVLTMGLCMKSYYLMPHGGGLERVGSSHSGGAFTNLPLPKGLGYEAVNVLGDFYLCEHIPFMSGFKNNYVNTNMTYLVKSNV